MTYIRRQPWRPRSSWLASRAGARRRGVRQDELVPAKDARQDGVDVVVSAASEAIQSEDTVVAQTVFETAAQSAVPARVDVSGLQAIAAIAPAPVSLTEESRAVPARGWFAYGSPGDDEQFLSRHSA